MQKMIVTMVLAAGFAVLTTAAPAQEQGAMMDHDDMSSMMSGESMDGGMDMGMMGMGGMMREYCMDHEGPGMMDGHAGGRSMMGLGPIWLLDLNPDQRAKINRIQLDLRKQLWSLKGKTFDSQAQLYNLYAADRPDPKKIGAVYGALLDVRRQMIEARIDAMNRARDVLSKEQLEKFKKMQRQYGGMMGAGGPMHHCR